MAQIIFVPYSSGGGPSAASESFEWNANGDLVSYDAQPGSFNGLPSSDAALVGPGPFDSQREVLGPNTVAALRLSQRAPAIGTTTGVEFYRIRAGVVTSLGVVSFVNSAQFETASAVPAVTDLVAGDLLFVSFSSVPGLDAADLSCWLELT